MEGQMKPLVVLVGHRKRKLKRLINLYLKNKPELEHDVFIVYNGEEPFSGADLYVKNDLRSRDIGKYYEAVKRHDRRFYFFMNDDIVHIEGKDWLQHALKKGTEIVGVQYNMTTMVPKEIILLVEEIGYPPLIWGKFLRTSAFGCTRDCFLRIWEKADGYGWKFEKQTIALSKSHAVFDDPYYIFDSDFEKYYKWYTRKSWQKKFYLLECRLKNASIRNKRKVYNYIKNHPILARAYLWYRNVLRKKIR